MSSVGDEEQTENPDFEALIDLLGTDDPDDEPQAGEQSFAPIANLRQADGRFDFSAIRDFFGVNLRSPQSVEGQSQPLRLPTLTAQPATSTPEQTNPVPHVSLPLPTPHFSPGRSFDQTFRSQTYLESPTPARLLNRLTSSTPASPALASPNRPASSLVPEVTTFDPEADAAALKAISPLSLPPAEVAGSPSQEGGPSSPIRQPGSRPLSRSLIRDEALAKSRPSTAPPDIFLGHKSHPVPATTTTPRPSHTRTNSQTIPWSSLKLPFPEIHFTAAATPSPAKPPTTTTSAAAVEDAEASVPAPVPAPVPSPVAPKSKGKSPEIATRGAGGGTPIVVPMPGGPLDDRDTSAEATVQLPPPRADYRLIADEIRRGFEENRTQAAILDSALEDVRAQSSQLIAQVAELQTIAAHLNDIDATQPPPPLEPVPVDGPVTLPGMDSDTAAGTSGATGVDDDGGAAAEPEPEPASFGTWTSLDDDEMLAHARALAMVDDPHAHHHQGAPDGDDTFTDIDPLAEDTQTATQLPRFPSGGPSSSSNHPLQVQREQAPEPETPQTASTPRGFGGNTTSSAPMDEIELMSGHEARRTLRALLTALGLLPSLESSEQPIHEQLLASVSHHSSSSTNSAPSERPTQTQTQPQSLEDVLRALDFVRSMDQLVWRGHRPPREGGLFGEKSVDSLQDRIQLWERAMRNPQVVPRIGAPTLRGASGGARIQTGQLRTSFGPGPSTSRSAKRERPYQDAYQY